MVRIETKIDDLRETIFGQYLPRKEADDRLLRVEQDVEHRLGKVEDLLQKLTVGLLLGLAGIIFTFLRG